ncbi:MAG TPA: L-threonylcarbamoyladenylate synthase [Candidatus Moranbacteria bacterium]|nr:L-threonylcarbamoyladenylate synthase [Candidatus Moranbacteria bacterium]HRZ33339.1 L-threonylcarbamoyladenylate synthase [Candidatus Moranbacteria bacterium]
MPVKNNSEKMLASILLSGGIGVFPTDTLYGVVGSALSKKSVERIYKLRKRESKKPMIILISSVKDLKIFGIRTNSKQRDILRKLWPGKISVIFDCPLKKFSHLHRGTKTLALRLPKDKWLISFLKKTGPLVAPSANIAGKKPAENFAETKIFFREKVDFYVDKGKLKSKPSTLIKIDKKGKIEILRQGAAKVK